MKHYSPDEFMTRGQRNALALADRIERAPYFNMFYWVRPDHPECPSCMGGHVGDMIGANLPALAWTDLRDLARDWLGFDREQASLAFTPPWVRECGGNPSRLHMPEHAARAVALLRHYAATGVVTWNAHRQTPAVMRVDAERMTITAPAWL